MSLSAFRDRMNPRGHRRLAALALSLVLHGSLAALLIHRSRNSLRLSESRAREGQRHRAEIVRAAKGFGPEWVSIILLPRTRTSGQASSPLRSAWSPAPFLCLPPPGATRYAFALESEYVVTNISE